MASAWKICVLWLLAASVFPQFCLAAQPDFSRFVPDSTTVFVSWNLTGAVLKDYEASALAAFLKDEEVSAALGKAPARRLARLGLSADDLAPFLNGTMAYAVIKSEAVSIDAGEEKREVTVSHEALIVAVADEKARALAQKILNIAESRAREENRAHKIVEHHGVKITVYDDNSASSLERDSYFTHKDFFVFATTEEAARDVAEGIAMGLAKPLSDNPNFVAAQKKAAAGSLLWGFVNVGQIAKKAADQKSAPGFGGRFDSIISAVGAGKVHTLAFSAAANAEGLLISAYLLGIDAESPLARLFSPVKGAAVMSLVTEDARSFVAISMKTAEAWALVDKMMKAEDTKSLFAKAAAAIAAGEKKGLDFGKDLVANLGDEALLLVPASPGKSGAGVLVWPVKDKAAVEKALLALLAGDGKEVVETQHNGGTIRTAGGASFVCTENYLIVGRDVDSVKAALDAARGGMKLLKDGEEYKKAVAALKMEPAIIGRVGTDAIAEALLKLLIKPSPQRNPASEGGAEGAPAASDKSDLPDAAKILKKFKSRFKYLYIGAAEEEGTLTVRFLLR